MGPYQWGVVVLALLCASIDGFDFFVMSFVVPYLPKGFASNVEVGYLSSAGVLGLGLGAAFLGQLADRIGRRKLVLIGLMLSVVGMVLSALAPDFAILLVARFMSGGAVGAIGVCAVLIAQEYSSMKSRNLAIGLNTVGFPMGSLIAGLVGVRLMDQFGGAYVPMFWVGATLSAVVLLVALFLFPESLEFLLTRSTPDAQRNIERAIGKLRLKVEVDPLARPLTDVPDDATTKPGLRTLLSARYRLRSLLLWSGFSVFVGSYYFIVTWTPQLVSQTTHNRGMGTIAGTMLSVGGFVGAILFGVIGFRASSTKIGWVAISIAGLAAAVFGWALSFGSVSLTLTLGAVLGLATFVGVTAYTAMAPGAYPAHIRATGYGWHLGISRGGAVLGPIAAGYLLSVVSPARLLTLTAIPLLLSAATVIVLWRHSKSEFAREQHMSAVDRSTLTKLQYEVEELP
jgi:MFS family permease